MKYTDEQRRLWDEVKDLSNDARTKELRVGLGNSISLFIGPEARKLYNEILDKLEALERHQQRHPL